MNKLDNNLFLLTTAIDPGYKLKFFPENLKNNVKRLLKSEVKNHSCRETCQSVEVSLVQGCHFTWKPGIFNNFYMLSSKIWI